MKRDYRPLMLFALALGLRLFLLGQKSLWIDECLAWGAVRMGWGDMVSALASGTPHPPLAFALMKLSSMIAGTSEAALRFPAALLTASAAMPVYRLAKRRTSLRGGLFAGLLWAVSPYSVSLGQEAWVYGITAALTLWFADTADRAWRGSRIAYIALFPLGAAGILTQHLFALSVGAGCLLFFSVPEDERTGFWRFAAVPLALFAIWLPVVLQFAGEFSERSSRMAAAGVSPGFSRLFRVEAPSAFFRILAGGLLPGITPNLLERPRMLAAYLLNSAGLLALGILPLFTWRRWKLPSMKWLWAALMIPFGLFYADSPGIRQLSVLWVPFSLTSAAVFTRYRLSGAVVCFLAAGALFPYYALNEFPYHRSNWREAVALVEASADPSTDAVVVYGGKSTALAWEYYSSTGLIAFAPAGDSPFAGYMERERVDPGTYLEDLTSSGLYRRIWVVLDIWGIPSVTAISPSVHVESLGRAGDDMEAGVVSPDP